MKKYYYNDGKDQHGPFTLDELKAQGIKRDTQVWFEGALDWMQAGEIPEIGLVIPPSINKHQPPPITMKQANESKPLSKKWVYWGIGLFVVFLFFSINTSARFAVLDIIDAVFYSSNTSAYNSENAEVAQVEIENEKASGKAAEKADQENKERMILEEKEKTLRHQINENFQQYFTATVAKATVHAFGGMSEVLLEVKNLTGYHAEEVHIYINYVKENGDIWKSERMTIQNLAQWETRKVQAPGSHRGDKVFSGVEFVVSNALGLDEGYGAE